MFRITNNTARAALAAAIREKLERQRGFEYADPGFGCPEWWADAANRLLKMQLEAVL